MAYRIHTQTAHACREPSRMNQRMLWREHARSNCNTNIIVQRQRALNALIEPHRREWISTFFHAPWYLSMSPNISFGHWKNPYWLMVSWVMSSSYNTHVGISYETHCSEFYCGLIIAQAASMRGLVRTMGDCVSLLDGLTDGVSGKRWQWKMAWRNILVMSKGEPFTGMDIIHRKQYQTTDSPILTNINIYIYKQTFINLTVMFLI